MKSIYKLIIQCDEDPSLITQTLDVEPTMVDGDSWVYEVIEREDDDYYDFINRFLDILDGKYSELRNIGVKTENISIWMNYEYDQQCNIEFSPKQMKRLGTAGIGLCISCWEEYERTT